MVEARVVLLVPLLLASLVAAARADDFYKGKTVDIIVGATPSGSFDIISRAMARHLGAHIPGTPSVIVQNMPGAGSIQAVRYVDTSAPKDGTVLGTFLPGVITQSFVTPEKINLDLSNLTWVGVVSPDYSRVCYGFGPQGVRSWDDLMRLPKDKPFIMGTTGTGASNYITGASLREVFQANVKIILGFPGSTELRIAVERGELDGDCGGFSSIPADWIRDDKAHPFVRFAEKLAPGIPDSAVYVGSLTRTDAQRQFLSFLYGADKLGRPFIMSRQVPADRQAIIRAAFNETMKDKGFIAEMEKLGETVMPLTGDEAEQIYQGIKNAPARVVAEARKIYE